MKILYEDNNLAVINKPAGKLTHPTDKGESDTLVADIIKQWPEIKQHNWPSQDRPGIVHRLDKDTSGNIVIAKNPKTLKYLQDQFKNRTVKKKYCALVLGKVTPKQGEIITQISRDKNKKHAKQAVSSFSFSWQKKKSRPAITYYKVIKYYQYKQHTLSFLELEIKTGRTHQIRTHLKHKGWPIIGDMLYNNKVSKQISKDFNLTRQFLHSKILEIEVSPKVRKVFESDIPGELDEILNSLTEII